MKILTAVKKTRTFVLHKNSETKQRIMVFNENISEMVVR